MSENQIDSLLKRNCSTMFLLHPLGLSISILEGLGFVEAYLRDEYNQTEYENPVFLLFKPLDLDLFQMFLDSEYMRENTYTKTFDLKSDYDRGDGEIVLVYEFPFRLDYETFLTGKYSKFSSRIRNTYPKIIKIKQGKGSVTILGSQYRIITKDKESEELLTKEYGDGFLLANPLETMASMLETKFGTSFTDDMEVWKGVDILKETLKL